MKRQIVQINQKFINSSYFVHKYLILYNQFERTHTEDVVMTPLHIKFFHNNRPGSYCRGTPRFRAYLKKYSCNLHALERVWKRFFARCASQFFGKFVWICRSLNARYYTLTLKERCFFECTFQNLFATNKRCAIMKQKQGQRSLGHGRDNEGLRSRTWSFF